jgi:N6-L-threonylcarbamoyladenine synthase
MIVLLVSGGHTSVLHITNDAKIEILANTIDDSFGESFDKCAKMLGLPYPGGPIIEELAKFGNNICNFTIPLKHSKDLAFSFSGLKNSVRLAVLSQKYDKNDIANSFQTTAIAHIIDKLEKIFIQYDTKNFGVVGGASANLYLREKLTNITNKYNKDIFFAKMEYCSDNGVMIGRAAIPKYKLQEFIVDIKVYSNSNIF